MISCMLLALLVANTTHWYSRVINDSVQSFVKDFLMIIFFLDIGLELKAAQEQGLLAHKRQWGLPAVAALGGMLIPTLFYLGINFQYPENYSGFAIPCATDIAFALCVFNLLGTRLPPSIRIFLLSIAIFDDLGAMALIAIFYKNGSIHPTLWGFIIGFSLPLIKKLGTPRLQSDLRVYLEKFQSSIHTLVQWVILPLFAFVSSGIVFSHASWNDCLNPIVMGISLGLLLGKPLGITGFSYCLIRLGWASLPSGSQIKHVGLCSVFAGIGFTMSLFMGFLAFDNAYQQSLVKIGILSGSLGCVLFAVIAIKRLKIQA